VITNETLKLLRVNFIALLDNTNNVVVYKNPATWAPEGNDLLSIAATAKGSSKRLGDWPTGVLDINGHLVLLSFAPVLPSGGSGPSRGTLILGRELDQSILAALSKAVGFTTWLEPAESISSSGAIQGLVWSDRTNSARVESDSTMLNYAAIQDLSGHTCRFLVGRTQRSLYLEAKTESRYLWGLLMLAGAVYCGILFFYVDEVLVARIAALGSEVSKITVSGDLSLRLNAAGKDELCNLAGIVNSMLAAIQKAKGELLQAQESLRFHAEHDALTGVLNRRAIRDVLRKELARCRREKNTLGVILADVDHFKKINDACGHAAGDAVLVTVVQRITAILRTYDALGRYGGEEFLIVAPNCDLAIAQKLAERIRSAIGDEAIDLGNDTAKVTVSMGVTLGTAESDPEFLVAQADTAMYNAKRNGRDRVEVSLSLPQEDTVEVNP
jgi:diguanylate cyclase (GGDEF)-like protein